MLFLRLSLECSELSLWADVVAVLPVTSLWDADCDELSCDKSESLPVSFTVVVCPDTVKPVPEDAAVVVASACNDHQLNGNVGTCGGRVRLNDRYS